MPTKQHQQKTVYLKKIQADEAIIPVLKWLNSFESVNTQYSCEGDHKTEWSSYVLFTCYEQEELIIILEILGKFYSSNGFTPRVEISYRDAAVPLRYHLAWHNKKCLLEFHEFLQDFQRRNR